MGGAGVVAAAGPGNCQDRAVAEGAPWSLCHREVGGGCVLLLTRAGGWPGQPSCSSQVPSWWHASRCLLGRPGQDELRDLRSGLALRVHVLQNQENPFHSRDPLLPTAPPGVVFITL